MQVWRSVRAGGDTKTRGSRRALALPERCVEVLEEHRDRQRVARAGERWTDRDLVFATEAGTAMDAANVRRCATAMNRVFRAAAEIVTQLVINPAQNAKKAWSGSPAGALTRPYVVGDTRIELVTSSVSRKRSPTELIARGGDGNRTRVQGFAGPCLSHSATPPVGGPAVTRGSSERTTGFEPATLTLAR